MHTATLRFTSSTMAGLVLWLLASAVNASSNLQPYGNSSLAPDFILPDLKDANHALTDYRGKVVLVNFWASWCPPCVKEMPGIQRLQEKLAKRPFTILSVNVGEQKYRVWKFVRLIDFTLPVLLDTRSKTFIAWDTSILPTSFLLDAAGRIRYRAQGDLTWDSDEVVSLIEKLINETENTSSEKIIHDHGDIYPRPVPTLPVHGGRQQPPQTSQDSVQADTDGTENQ